MYLERGRVYSRDRGRVKMERGRKMSHIERGRIR
jgi:hypothetical protein